MNILDLRFEFGININFDGDFDGGSYDLDLSYEIASHGLYANSAEIHRLKQSDIDALYEGVMKLAKALKPNITQGY
jgi:hypothetical protein